jgi:superfamily II DNA or RNA helicase
MKRLVIEGATGSGKTYTAIQMAKMFGGFFAYFSPTGLLAYETYMTYAKKSDCLNAKGIKFNTRNFCDFYGTYGAAGNLKNYNTIIIDEAHWVTSEFPHQSNFIKDVVQKFKGNVLLVTATRNFLPPEGFEILKLKSRFAATKKFRVPRHIFENRLEMGHKSLIICDRISDCHDWEEYYTEFSPQVATRRNSEDEILKSFIDFKKGKTQLLIVSNIGAQGVNLPCSNLMLDVVIPYEKTMNKQKVGRLGRPCCTTKTQAFTVIDCVDDRRIYDGDSQEDYLLIDIEYEPADVDWDYRMVTDDYHDEIDEETLKKCKELILAEMR